MKRIDFPVNKGRIIGALVVFLIFLVASSVFLWLGIGIGNGAAIPGAVGVVIFGLVSIISIRQLLDKRHLVSISADGITVRSWKGKWLNWDEINRIDLETMERGTEVIFFFTVEKDYMMAPQNLKMSKRKFFDMIKKLKSMKAEDRQNFIDDFIQVKKGRN